MLVITFLFILGLLAVVLKNSELIGNKNKEVNLEVDGNINNEALNQEEMAEPDLGATSSSDILGGPSELGTPEEQKVFQQILNDLADCLDIKYSTGSDSAPLSIESLIAQVASDLGPATIKGDRFMNWHLQMSDGSEKRLRLEINEDEEGVQYKELKYFSVDGEGLPTPLPLTKEQSENPTDDFIQQMLKSGEVLYKEKAGYLAFSGGEHVEYFERNGVLSELEFQKNDRYYRCQGLKSRDSCQCIR